MRASRWLLVVALLYRALIPTGYMPAFPSTDAPAVAGMHRGGWIMLCPGGLWESYGRHGLFEQQCFFGMAAAPTLPGSAVALVSATSATMESPPIRLSSGLLSAPSLRPPVRGPPRFL